MGYKGGYIMGSLLKVDSEMLEKTSKLVKEKISKWNEVFPSLNFDEHGRSHIAAVPDLTEEKLQVMRNCSNEFQDAFNIYLKDREYTIKHENAEYYEYFNSWFMSLSDYISNYYHFRKKDGRLVKVKASKVLAAVQAIWEKNYCPEYGDICKQIKELRKDGASYSNSIELQQLVQKKEQLEKGNLYIEYQKLMNSNNGNNTDIFLTINPLDLLTASGDSCGNPTAFSSCWSTKIFDYDDHFLFESEGCYGFPDAIYKLGKIKNRGMLYIPNGRIVDHPELNFSFLGYKERVHVWFDTNPKGLWLEKVYPTKTYSALQKFSSALSEKNIESITFDFSDKYDFKEFHYNDYDGLDEYINSSHWTFLDKVFVEDSKLYYMPEYRVEYDYNDGSSRPDNDDYQTCYNCGDRTYNYYVVDGEFYCSDCYRDLFVNCVRCGCDVAEDDAIYDYDGNPFCPHCADQYLSQCEDCEEYVYSDTMYAVRDSDDVVKYVCTNCFESNYTLCDECGEYYEDLNEAYDSEGNRCNVCNYCLDTYFVECSCCRKYHHEDNVIDDLCNNCYGVVREAVSNG